MGRFDDFTKKEKAVIRTALEWTEPEFYDPGHTEEDRDVLWALIREAKEAEHRASDPGAIVPMKRRPAEETQEADIDLTPEKQPEPEPAQARRLIGWLVTDTTAKQEQEAQEDKDERPPENRRGNREVQPREYNGFLFVECDSCGDRHAFCAKKPISVYRCNECGGRTPLTDMRYLRVACECGAKFSYNTNVDTDMMDVNCFKCGSPVTVEWSERRQRYQPIGYHNTGGRRRKK